MFCSRCFDFHSIIRLNSENATVTCNWESTMCVLFSHLSIRARQTTCELYGEEDSKQEDLPSLSELTNLNVQTERNWKECVLFIIKVDFIINHSQLPKTCYALYNLLYST